ncbi:uncharacterized protein LOC130450710 [Diorhabda sublineata]|uniref:uncharacterized protein LOC130450710 n=1 Tax=Diorhabda sublineata TaxID=1163346 RepID=UPI0024E0E397|nr:uncharacterized protein LOC130450710 [Diorhabda sublineata]
MKIFSILLLCAVSVPHLNAIPVELVQKNIPVDVIYDQIIPGIVSREQILQHGRRNLDERVQLSSDELPQALKHLPTKPEILEKLQLTTQEKDGSKLKTLLEPAKEAEIIELAPVESSPKVQVNNEIPSIKSVLNPEDNQQQKAVKSPLDNVLSESQKIINDGLKNLKESFTPGKDEFSPSSEQWAALEKQVHQYFDEQKNALVKQTQTETVEAGSTAAPATQPGQTNWFQNLATGVSTIATNFVQNLQNFGGNNSGATAPVQGDEGTPGQQPGNQGLQNFISFINNGFGNLVSTISGTNNQGPTTSNTNLSDSGSASATPGGPVGFFGSVISNFQNALGIQQGQGGNPTVQGDTGTQQQNGGPGQIFQSVGSAISNFFQGGATSPANSQGDTGTAPPQSNNNFIQNIQNAFSNLNPFKPQGGLQNPQNPPNSIQTAIQNAGNQLQQFVPGNGGTSSPQPIEIVSPDEVKPVTEDDIKKESNVA